MRRVLINGNYPKDTENKQTWTKRTLIMQQYQISYDASLSQANSTTSALSNAD